MKRACLFHGVGHPFEIVRHDVPEPRETEVLVRVTCCTVCRSDLHTQSGRRIEPTPTVLGHEIVGRIEAFGPAASRFDGQGTEASLGDRITWSIVAGCGRCFFCRKGLVQKCERLFKYGHQKIEADHPFIGGFADLVMLAPNTNWLRVPEGIDDRVAAPVNCAFATAAAVVRQAGPIAGGSVLILGAGMLGVTACALARDAGAELVVAADSAADALRRAKSFGATHAVLTDYLKEAVAETTKGRGFDAVLELAGTASSTMSAIQLARIGGTVVLAGTTLPTPGVAFDPEKVVRRMLTIRGNHNYAAEDLAKALAYLAGPGRRLPFDSLIGQSFPLDEVEQAFAYAHAHPGPRVAIIP